MMASSLVLQNGPYINECSVRPERKSKEKKKKEKKKNLPLLFPSSSSLLLLLEFMKSMKGNALKFDIFLDFRGPELPNLKAIENKGEQNDTNT